MLPSELPQAERDLAAEYGAKVSAAERDAPGRRGPRCGTFDRSAPPARQEAPADPKAERAERRRLKRAANEDRAGAVPPLPADPEVERLYRRLGRVIDAQAAGRSTGA